MNRHSRRAIILVCTMLVALLLWQGHTHHRTGAGVAFVRSTPGEAQVKISGSVRYPGVYRICDGASLKDVIVLADSDIEYYGSSAPRPGVTLHSGDHLLIHRYKGKSIEISLQTMRVQDKIILGIPLSLNRLSVEEWQLLPGIGISLAKSINAYRQYNGDFTSPTDLLQIPGIGMERLKSIAPYFTQQLTNCNYDVISSNQN